MDSSIIKVWTYPFFQIGMSVRNKNRMANSVDPDETARYEPSQLDLHGLQKCQGWFAGLKELICQNMTKNLLFFSVSKK